MPRISVSIVFVALLAAVGVRAAEPVTNALPPGPRVVPPMYGWETTPVLRAGFAAADISPDSDRDLIGYGFRDDGNAGVLEPLLARVLALRDATNRTAVLVGLDLAVFGLKEARKLRHDIATELDTDPARVLVWATHTHSGPAPTRGLSEGKIRPAVMEAVRRAAGLGFPVRAFVREAPLGIAYNRRVKTPDGRIRNCWGPQEWFDRVPDPAPDPACSVLLLRQVNGPRTYVLWSVGAHPVVLGRTSRLASGDYPGRACSLIEQYMPGSRAVFAVGACGNTQPWIATQEDPAQLEKVARCAASFVAVLAEAAYPVTEGHADLRIAAGTVYGKHTEFDVSVWRLGAAWIVGIPAELFQQLGLDLRQRLGGPVLLATLANGGGPYLPTRAAFQEGGYEVDAARGLVEPGEGEYLVDEIVKLADTIRPE